MEGFDVRGEGEGEVADQILRVSGEVDEPDPARRAGLGQRGVPVAVGDEVVRVRLRAERARRAARSSVGSGSCSMPPPRVTLSTKPAARSASTTRLMSALSSARPSRGLRRAAGLPLGDDTHGVVIIGDTAGAPLMLSTQPPAMHGMTARPVRRCPKRLTMVTRSPGANGEAHSEANPDEEPLRDAGGDAHQGRGERSRVPRFRPIRPSRRRAAARRRRGSVRS